MAGRPIALGSSRGIPSLESRARSANSNPQYPDWRQAQRNSPDKSGAYTTPRDQRSHHVDAPQRTRLHPRSRPRRLLPAYPAIRVRPIADSGGEARNHRPPRDCTYTLYEHPAAVNPFRGLSRSSQIVDQPTRHNRPWHRTCFSSSDRLRDAAAPTIGTFGDDALLPSSSGLATVASVSRCLRTPLYVGEPRRYGMDNPSHRGCSGIRSHNASPRKEIPHPKRRRETGTGRRASCSWRGPRFLPEAGALGPVQRSAGNPWLAAHRRECGRVAGGRRRSGEDGSR